MKDSAGRTAQEQLSTPSNSSELLLDTGVLHCSVLTQHTAAIVSSCVSHVKSRLCEGTSIGTTNDGLLRRLAHRSVARAGTRRAPAGVA